MNEEKLREDEQEQEVEEEIFPGDHPDQIYDLDPVYRPIESE